MRLNDTVAVPLTVFTDGEPPVGAETIVHITRGRVAISFPNWSYARRRTFCVAAATTIGELESISVPLVKKSLNEVWVCRTLIEAFAVTAPETARNE